MRTHLPSLVVVLVLLTGVAACSSDNDSGKALTKSELISRGDKVCRSYDNKIDAIKSPGGEVTDSTPPADVKKWEKPYGQLADYLDEEADSLAKLTPPTVDSESYAKVVSDLRIQAEYAKQAAAAARSGDPTGVQNSLEIQKTADADSEQFLTNYGFKVCGS